MTNINELQKRISDPTISKEEKVQLKKKVEKILKSWGYNWSYAKATREVKKLEEIKEITLNFVPTTKTT